MEIRQVEYLGWQDHGVPEDPNEVLRLLEYLNSLPGANNEPIVTHCSAGVGRTGTFISIAWLVPLLARLRQSPNDMNVLAGTKQSSVNSPLGPLPLVPPSSGSKSSTVLGMLHRDKDNNQEDGFDPVMAVIDGCRDQRTTMVQTSKQVDFVYEVARTWWQKAEKSG